MMDLNLGDTQLIIETGRRNGLLRNQLAYVLATSFWETARTMKPVREAFWLSESWRKRELRYYPWYGRGYVQLTWEANYKKAGDILGVDLMTDPDVVMQPAIAAEILIRGSMDGWFTGRKIPDFITLQKSDFVGARKVVNGTDKRHEISAIAIEYNQKLTDAGYGVNAAATNKAQSWFSRLTRGFFK